MSMCLLKSLALVLPMSSLNSEEQIVSDHRKCAICIQTPNFIWLFFLCFGLKLLPTIQFKRSIQPVISERDPNSALPPPVIGGFSPTVIGQVIVLIRMSKVRK